jgi:hypothetical protein
MPVFENISGHLPPRSLKQSFHVAADFLEKSKRGKPPLVRINALLMMTETRNPQYNMFMHAPSCRPDTNMPEF